MAKKYKINLKQKVLSERSFQERQEGLKAKYDIDPDKEVVVVEKSNTFKFTVKTVAVIFRLCATIILLILAFVGLVAIVYPAPREQLQLILQMALEQLRLNFGV